MSSNTLDMMRPNSVVAAESTTRTVRPTPSNKPFSGDPSQREGVRAEREPRETAVEEWRHLVRREHPWRKQLYVKGRNMTARQLVGGIIANKLDEQKAAANYDLPIEAVREALHYVQNTKELLEIEAEIERLMLKRGGVVRGPQPVSG